MDVTNERDDFGALLASRRRAAGWTQEELATDSQLSVRAIGNIERGRTRAPQQRSARALADSLKLDHRERQRFLTAARRERPRRRPNSPQGQDGLELPHGALCALPRTGVLIGRTEELARIREIVWSAPGPAILFSGLPGVGKTRLVVTAANELCARFPDGQLFLDLRGMDDEPLRPEDALTRLLRALNMPSERIPTTLDERASLWRSMTMRRRLLLVLDDAAGEAQVGPLVPAGTNCMTLITARRALRGLEATHRMCLDVPAHDDAVELLRTILGPARVAAERSSVNELLAACGRLPLALRIAGNRIAGRPQWTIRSFGDQLVHRRRRLDVLSAGDVHLRPVLLSAYRQLTERGRLVFRRLALVRDSNFDISLASVAAEVTLGSAAMALTELHDAGLVRPTTSEDHYRFHVLVHAFAIEMLSADDSVRTQRAAAERMTRRSSRTTVNLLCLLERAGDAPADREPEAYGLGSFARNPA